MAYHAVELPGRHTAEYLAPGLAAGNRSSPDFSRPDDRPVAAELVRVIEEADLPPGLLNPRDRGRTGGRGRDRRQSGDRRGWLHRERCNRSADRRTCGGQGAVDGIGGNGPVIILADADLEKAAAATASGCFVNAGQVCSSSERIIVHAAVYDEFAERMAAAARAVVLGDPARGRRHDGPLNNPGVAAKVAAHVQDAIERGAVTIAGGGPAHDRPSASFEPTASAMCPGEPDQPRGNLRPVAPLLRGSERRRGDRPRARQPLWSRLPRSSPAISPALSASSRNSGGDRQCEPHLELLGAAHPLRRHVR